jgi:hypothetical protein
LCLYAGAIALPADSPPPHQPLSRLEAIAASSQARLVFLNTLSDFSNTLLGLASDFFLLVLPRFIG